LKEATVRSWKEQYCEELEKRSKKRSSCNDLITQLPAKRQGRPLLTHFEAEIKLFLEAMQIDGNTHIAIGTAIGVISSYVAEHRGPISVTKDWAKQLLARMGSVKRHGTTKAKINPLDFEALKKQYLADIRTKVYTKDIPADLIINWDHTWLKYVPMSNWTMEHKGAKRVEIAGSDDKRQLTALFSYTLSRKFLPPQVIYAGKSPACLPKVTILNGWNLTFTPNHWSNEQTIMTYLQAILIPYVEKTRADLNLSKNRYL